MNDTRDAELIIMKLKQTRHEYQLNIRKYNLQFVNWIVYKAKKVYFISYMT